MSDLPSRLYIQWSALLGKMHKLVERRKLQHWLGVLSTLIAVLSWTSSAFLMSSMFADHSYSKPFLVSYLTSGLSAFLLVPIFVKHLLDRNTHSSRPKEESTAAYHPIADESDERPSDDISASTSTQPASIRSQFNSLIRPALILYSLWTLANYLNAASFTFTTVASSTILTSTCSFHVLVLGALFGVERLTARKLTGVITSIIGITAISLLDTFGDSTSGGSAGDVTTPGIGPGGGGGTGGLNTSHPFFPSKTGAEMAVGDSMAFVSAIISAINTIVIKRLIEDSSPRNMALFFGMMGVLNTCTLWPVFGLLHWSGAERLQMPPNASVWLVLGINGLVCLLGNYAWAYAVVLTSPTVVTVGLTLSIPLSLAGQSVLQAQFAGVPYWLGAGVVVIGFLLVEGEVAQAVADPDVAVVVEVPVSSDGDRDDDVDDDRRV